MSMVIATVARPDLLQRWRQQVAGRQRKQAALGPRRLAAISYLASGLITDRLVDVQRMMFVTLYDELLPDGALAIRVAGHSSAKIPWGIRFGGAQHCRFDRNLALAPSHEARGRRFELTRNSMLSLALDLDRCLQRHQNYPHLRRLRQPRWPQLWAGFSPEAIDRVSGDGPELLNTCCGQRTSAETLAASRRTLGQLVLYPLEYVSHHWREFAAVYADLSTIPKRQVIHLENPSNQLQGHVGAMEFDLFHSRFTHVDI